MVECIGCKNETESAFQFSDGAKKPLCDSCKIIISNMLGELEV